MVPLPWLSGLLFALLTQGASAQEPARPDVWTQSFEVRCGRDRLSIAGYGTRLPERAPVVLLNGRTLRGERTERLSRDLARPAAVYRLSGQCLPARGGIWLRIQRDEFICPGERPPCDRAFHSAAATLRNGRIERYDGMLPSTEEAFWFR